MRIRFDRLARPLDTDPGAPRRRGSGSLAQTAAMHLFGEDDVGLIALADHLFCDALALPVPPEDASHALRQAQPR